MTNRERIISLLRGTNRAGIDNLISWMDENGFFTAPCSGSHHLAVEGGLARHSLNVFEVMYNKLATELLDTEDYGLTSENIIIASLLHDLGKCGDFGKPNYVDNYLKKTDADGNPVRSESKPYVTNPDLLYVPHEVRSISIASRFISLTEEEYFAILMHNGLYGDFRYSIKDNETPLYLMLHMADMWASRVLEVENIE